MVLMVGHREGSGPFYQVRGKDGEEVEVFYAKKEELE